MKDEIDISCPLFVLTLKCTSSHYVALIGHSKMSLTDVDFSFQTFHWLFENDETDQGDCLTVFDYFKETNNFYLYLNCTWMTVVDSLTTDFEMFETCELLSWYFRGCNRCLSSQSHDISCAHCNTLFFVATCLPCLVEIGPVVG